MTVNVEPELHYVMRGCYDVDHDPHSVMHGSYDVDLDLYSHRLLYK